MIKKFVISFACCVLAQTLLAESDAWKFTRAQNQEMQAMTEDINRPSLAWRAAAIQRKVTEANFFADRLHLPMRRPIQIWDVVDDFTPGPWFSVIHDTKPPYSAISVFGTNIFNSKIPRDERLRSLEIGADGSLETTNFQFFFYYGKLREIMRLDSPEIEYYAHRLDELIGKPSLIDTNGAYQLATQWLAVVDVDMTALNKLKWTVNQLHYRARGATNYVTLPLYYVNFGNKHTPASGNLHAYDEPLVSVEILGTTKELQDLTINDLSLSRRPLLLITNALDLARTPNPPVKQLQTPAMMKAFGLTPLEVSNYSRNFSTNNPLTKQLQPSIIQTNSVPP